MILVGDCREMLRTLPDQSVHCCVTSPPYFGLRDYGTASWEGGAADCDHLTDTKHQTPGASTARAGRSNVDAQRNDNFRLVCGKCGATRVDQQIGLEPTPDEYATAMVETFREVRRVLRDDGTLWLNVGDSYANDGKWGGHTGGKHAKALHCSPIGRQKKYTGLKPKDLIGIPWMLAVALRADGWYLRQDIIWWKKNTMPESVRDRCTKSHEYIFLLTKRPKYFFDSEAIKEPMASSSIARLSQDVANQVGTTRANGGAKTNGNMKAEGNLSIGMRNKRDVWHVGTKPFKEAHFATFPPDLIEPCILAGTSAHGVCSDCGAPWVRQVERKAMVIERSDRTHDLGRTRSSGTMIEPPTTTTTGWQPTCDCNAPLIPATVLDPFFGAGTTGLVAQQHGRDYIGVELNPEYVDIAERRIAAAFPPDPLAAFRALELSLVA